MDNILKEAKALTLGQSSTISRARKATTSFSDQKREAYKKNVSFEPTPFPKNEYNIMPCNVYNEMRQWYNLAAIPEDKRSKKDNNKLKVFKFPSLAKHKGYSEENKKRSAARKAEA